MNSKSDSENAEFKGYAYSSEAPYDEMQDLTGVEVLIVWAQKLNRC